MNQTEFYVDRYRRALKKANAAIGQGALDKADAYAKAARYYNSGMAVSAGAALVYDEVLEVLHCELEAITYDKDTYADARFRPGLLCALGLIMQLQQKHHNGGHYNGGKAND
jgi:hypothetical protein